MICEPSPYFDKQKEKRETILCLSKSKVTAKQPNTQISKNSSRHRRRELSPQLTLGYSKNGRILDLRIRAKSSDNYNMSVIKYFLFL